MKKSAELKLAKAGKMRELNAILDKAEKENKRALSTEENTSYEAIKREVDDLNAQIERALFSEANPAEPQEPQEPQEPNTRHIKAPYIKRNVATAYNTGKAVREFMIGGAAGLTGLEKEAQQELGRGISSNGILVPAFKRELTPSTPTTNADAIDMIVDPNLSVFGKAPMWEQMGITILPGLTTSVTVNKKAPAVAEQVAVSAAITAQGGSPEGVILTPKRIGISDLFGKELLSQANPMVQAAIINDLIKGADRKLTAKVWDTAKAAATAVAGAGLDVAGFNALMAQVDGDGAFLMARSTFFKAKNVTVGTVTDKFLVALNAALGAGFGLTHDGANAFYSSLFTNAVNTEYAVYGNMAEIWAGLWGAVEILINPYTHDSEGQVKLTVNRIADMVSRNDEAFAKTPDLDVAV